MGIRREPILTLVVGLLGSWLFVVPPCRGYLFIPVRPSFALGASPLSSYSFPFGTPVTSTLFLV